MITASNLLTRIPPLFSDLSKILVGDIDCSQSVLARYSEDNSPYRITPQAVIYPKNATDIKHVLSFAREYKMPITVCGKRSSHTGGALGEGIILDMTRHFNHIRNINMLENTITVDAGVTIASLIERLHGWQFDLPIFVGSNDDATVGGSIAIKNASAGSAHHGTVREWIEGMTVVVDNGEEHTIADGITPSGRLLGIYQEVFPQMIQEGGILRASKPKSYDDGTGYNLWNTSIGPRQLIDQLVGSEGTLGIITSVTFRIAPLKKHSITTCIPVAKKELLSTYVEIAKHHKSEYIYVYDEAFMQLSERYQPTHVPFFLDTPYTLLVTHTGTDKEKLHHSVRTFRTALPVEDHLLKTLDGRSTFEKIIKDDFLFSLFSMYTGDALTPITVGNGLIVTLPQLSPFLTQLEHYLGALGRLYTITGNIGSGHISVVTLFDPLSRTYDDDVLHYTKTIFSLLAEYKGGISAVDGEGIMRTPFLPYIFSDGTLAIFKKIKDIWDPLSILNPGKKSTVTTSYIQQHTKHVSSLD